MNGEQASLCLESFRTSPRRACDRLARLVIVARGYWNELTYAYERCDDCKRRLSPMTGSWWSADDPLWDEVIGTPWGIFCPPCFTKRCRDKGIHVYWKPVVDSRVAK